jgi:hypothetical protein
MPAASIAEGRFDTSGLIGFACAGLPTCSK